MPDRPLLLLPRPSIAKREVEKWKFVPIQKFSSGTKILGIN